MVDMQASPRREAVQGEPTEIEGYNRYNPAPFIYACQFNRGQDMIMAAGAGANQVRLFDYRTRELLCTVSQMRKPVLCLTQANTCSDFCFGSADSRLRIMQMRKLKESR